MTDRPPEDPGAPADRTRDIALPPLPDRPPPALPKEWVGMRPAASPLDAPTTAVTGPPRPPSGPAPAPGPPAPADVAEEASDDLDPEVAEGRRLARQRTDEMLPPPRAAVRERTLAFTSPEMRHRPIGPVQVGSRPRRWPWVVLTLLPIVIIVASAIAWLLLLAGG